MVRRIAAVAKHNHVGLRRVAALAHFADAGIVVASVGAAATGRCFLRRVEMCRPVDLAPGLGLDAFHRELFLADTVVRLFLRGSDAGLALFGRTCGRLCFCARGFAGRLWGLRFRCGGLRRVRVVWRRRGRRGRSWRHGILRRGGVLRRLLELLGGWRSYGVGRSLEHLRLRGRGWRWGHCLVMLLLLLLLLGMLHRVILLMLVNRVRHLLLMVLEVLSSASRRVSIPACEPVYLPIAAARALEPTASSFPEPVSVAKDFRDRSGRHRELDAGVGAVAAGGHLVAGRSLGGGRGGGAGSGRSFGAIGGTDEG